jgi:hypothetical protein
LDEERGLLGTADDAIVDGSVEAGITDPLENGASAGLGVADAGEGEDDEETEGREARDALDGNLHEELLWLEGPFSIGPDLLSAKCGRRS